MISRLKVVTLALALSGLACAGASAQGTFNPGGAMPRSSSPAGGGFGAPSTYPRTGAYGSAPAHPATIGAPQQPTPFKPYEPPKYGSPYGAMPAAPHGAKDCELSVYVNACGHRR